MRIRLRRTDHAEIRNALAGGCGVSRGVRQSCGQANLSPRGEFCFRFSKLFRIFFNHPVHFSLEGGGGGLGSKVATENQNYPGPRYVTARFIE